MARAMPRPQEVELVLGQVRAPEVFCPTCGEAAPDRIEGLLGTSARVQPEEGRLLMSRWAALGHRVGA